MFFHPYDWKKDFSDDYLPEIRFVCLAMTDAYIGTHFDNIRNHGSDIENRLYDSDCTVDWFKIENRKIINGFGQTGNQVILLDKDYEETIREVLSQKKLTVELTRSYHGLSQKK